MRYRVYDEEDKKERIIDEVVSIIPQEVGTTRKVIIKNGNKREEHHFRILEVLPDNK